ncbi:MAG: hypothetical protein CM15mP74_07150 [Halieaceae bacterium]|nr:MAG: hypothetical protein CM15mP74_07150 [Halieaceae bacterium]
MIPVFQRLQLISVYEYLETRFDLSTRLLLSAVFQVLRLLAAAVTIYGVSAMIDLITGVGFLFSVLLFGAFTVLYDVLGGIRAVIWSDVMQMGLLVGVLCYLLWVLAADAGGLPAMLAAMPEDRLMALDFSHHGLGDGQDFAFWPMLIGGFFLYVSYYGCDQSQVQRQLCAANQRDGQIILLLNGLLRFPLGAALLLDRSRYCSLRHLARGFFAGATGKQRQTELQYGAAAIVFTGIAGWAEGRRHRGRDGSRHVVTGFGDQQPLRGHHGGFR